MIKEIHIKNVATYGDNDVVVKDLKKVNFFFGANGTGKTTISRIIANPQKYSDDCSVQWDLNTPLKTLIYNRDFVEENFNPQENLKGIFTLGEAEANTQERIKAIEGVLSDIDAEIRRKHDEKAHKNTDLEEYHGKFNDDLWQEQKKYEKDFKPAFKNLGTKNNNREKFLEKYECYKDTPQASLKLETLKERAQTVFAENPARIDPIEILEPDEIAEIERLTIDQILQRKIIPASDVPLKALFEKLDNTNWVISGLHYPHSAGDPCPFCQQVLTADIAAQLDRLVDDEYKSNIDALQKLRAAYEAKECAIRQKLLNAIRSNRLVDTTEGEALLNSVKLIIEANKRKIAEKIQNPPMPMVLDSSSEILGEIANFLDAANNKIDEHNTLIDNKKAEEKKLVADIWAFLVTEKNAAIITYRKAEEQINAEIKKICNDINIKNTEKIGQETELKELQKNLVSAQPTVDAINAMLKQFGFTNFELTTYGDKKQFYKIKRLGEEYDAMASLSEGERNFITFLYFYHLIKGSHSTDDSGGAQIIVFDDPVSSLDSNVLFIVSELMVSLIRETNQSMLRQFFILTHNIYFHKEISDKFEKNKDKHFFIVRKNSDVSSITPYDINPIKSSYECLWLEIRMVSEAQNTDSAVTIQNIMRKIIEYYFQFLGGIDKQQLVKKFGGENKKIAKALISFMDSGSHRSGDDLYYDITGSLDNYLTVFKELFVSNGHEAHYNMMMKGN